MSEVLQGLTARGDVLLRRQRSLIVLRQDDSLPARQHERLLRLVDKGRLLLWLLLHRWLLML